MNGVVVPMPVPPARSKKVTGVAVGAGTATTRPRMLVSAHFVFSGRVGGAEHMLYNLLFALGPQCADLAVLCGSERNLDPLAVDTLRRQPSTRVLERGAGHGPRFLAEQRACLAPDLAGDAILFPNYFVPPIRPRRLGRTATVLHDFQYRHFPEHFSARKRAWLRATQSFAVHAADRVIVISQFVAEDALRLFGHKIEHKLSVIPNPISWERFEAAGPTRSPLDKPYILAVAAQYPHKNLEVLIRAFAHLARSNREIQLVLCGQPFGGLRGVAAGRSGTFAPLVESLGIADRVQLTGYVDDAALGRWYRHAELFAFPSLFEGFGMPAVEALGLGLPVLTTKMTALPEVTLGLAQYVDAPSNVGEWASRLADILRHPAKSGPTVEDVASLRARYAPAAIASRYLAACCAD